MSSVPYSALKDDLFFPCKNAQFFPGGTPRSEAALCAELSRLAYCSVSADPATLNLNFDQARINQVLAAVGFSASSFHESSGKAKGQGAHCFIAVRQDNQLAIVAFRGTDKNDPTDVAADCDALFTTWPQGGRVHKGFNGFLNDLLGTLEPAVNALTSPRVLYTGHSLGAALATLLASKRRPSALYTFGSPLVGDAAFAATIAGDNYRFVDCCDIVTRIPPAVPGGYQHAGKPYYIYEARITEFDPAESDIFIDRARAVMEYTFKFQSWRKENVGARELADHAPVNYVTAVAAAPINADGTPVKVGK